MIEVTDAQAALYAVSLSGIFIAPWLFVWAVNQFVDLYIAVVGR